MERERMKRGYQVALREEVGSGGWFGIELRGGSHGGGMAAPAGMEENALEESTGAE